MTPPKNALTADIPVGPTVTADEESEKEKRLEAHRLVVEKRIIDELGIQIARRFAAKSVQRCQKRVSSPRDDSLDEVQLRYERIAEKLFCLQVKQYGAPVTPKEEQGALKALIFPADNRAAIAAYLRRRRPFFFERAPLYRFTIRLGDPLVRRKLINSIEHHVRRFLLTNVARDPSAELDLRLSSRPRVLTRRAIYLLAAEGLRDPITLRHYLDALFKHFHKIYDPTGVHRQSVVLHQIAERFRLPDGQHDWIGLCAHLEKIGAMPRRLRGDPIEALRKLLSRESATARKQSARLA